MAREDVTLKVKKYIFLGASVSDKLGVTDSLIEVVKKISDEEEKKDSVAKWFRVERLKKVGECVVLKKLHEQPEDIHVQMEKDRDTDYSFQYVIDAESVMKEVDPKLRTSALVTAQGLGAYIIAFPLDSFAEDVPKASKLGLVREICDCVSVIRESAISHQNKILDEYDSIPQVILLGTHRGVDLTEVECRQKAASELLRQKLVVDEAKCNIIPAPGSDVHSSLENMWKLGGDKVAEIEVPVRHFWIEAYLSSSEEKKAKCLSKPVPKQDYRREIENILGTKLKDEEFDKLFDVFHLLGWLVTHKLSDQYYVFSQTYLCEIFQNLAKNGGIMRNCLTKIRMILQDKGLVVKFNGNECVVPSVFEKYNDNPPESAAPFYLVIVKGIGHISPISDATFWRMITAVEAKEGWRCDKPSNCDYIFLQYGIYSIHISLSGEVIKVAVEKYANDSPKASNMKKFAETCQKIQKSLLNALEEIVGANKVRWGFACEGNCPTEDSSSPCIATNNAVDPDQYCFVCPHKSQPCLTLRHEVWFSTKIPEGHQLVKDKGIWTVPESVNQPGSDPPSSSAPFDSDEFNHPPSDAGLLGVVKKLPDSWNELAISLGVPIADVKAFSKKDLGEVLALQYWRDGKSGEGYDTTWTFLLKKVSENDGSNVAEDLKKEAMKNYPSWWKLGSTD